jgi:hypothetical protein
MQSLSVPQFMTRKFRLPCIAFRVTEVRRRRGQATGVKADGIHNLSVRPKTSWLSSRGKDPLDKLSCLSVHGGSLSPRA